MVDLHAYISTCWTGKEKLWRVFWLWFLCVPVLLSVALVVIVREFSLGRNFEEWLHYVLIFAFVYGPWVLVSLWRCAFNAEWKLWGYLVRIWVVVFSFIAVVLLSSPFWFPWLSQAGY